MKQLKCFICWHEIRWKNGEKADTYTFIPGQDNYNQINKDLNVWGSYFYKEANDVARVVVTTATDSLEALSMVLPKRQQVVLNMGWDKVRVAIPLQ
jgi:hypothetical protein